MTDIEILKDRHKIDIFFYRKHMKGICLVDICQIGPF